MPRGHVGKEGDTFINQNGYHYTKTDGKWRATAHLIAEEKLGRPLNHSLEMVKFVDGDRTNLNPDNISTTPRRSKHSKEARVAVLESRIAELQAELEHLRES